MRDERKTGGEESKGEQGREMSGPRTEGGREVTIEEHKWKQYNEGVRREMEED